MEIPKRFKLINTTAEVEKSNSFNNVSGHLGYSNYSENKIQLDDSTYWRCHQEEGFCHELTHWILFKMQSDLEKDEKFVGLFGELLCQALSTQERE